MPAYDHLLKLSHTFNLLDARGAVGMTERAECFAAMRNLARQVTGQCSPCTGHTSFAAQEYQLIAERKSNGGRSSLQMLSVAAQDTRFGGIPILFVLSHL